MVGVRMNREEIIKQLKDDVSKDQKKELTPQEERQLLIMVQSCQRDAVTIIRTKYLTKGIKQDIPIKDLIKETQTIRDLLLKNIVEGYWRVN